MRILYKACNRYALMVSLLILTLRLFGAQEVAVKRSYFSVNGTSPVFVQDDKYGYMQSQANWQQSFTDRRVTNTVILGIDHTRLQSTSSTLQASVELEIRVTKWNGTSFYQEILSPVNLEVQYSATGDYQSEDYFRFKDAYQVVVVVNNSTNVGDEALYLESRIESERYYDYQLSKVPPQDSIYRIVSDNWAKVSWPYIPGAEAYDLEWAYLDTVNKSNIGQLSYDFTENVTRVRVHANAYEVPLIYNQGVVFFRYRPIYYNTTDYGISVEGKWSTDKSGLGTSNSASTMLALGNGNYKPYVVLTTPFDADRNWVAQSLFNENGVNILSTSFSDGMGRTRQSQVSNSEEQQTLASNAVFDSEGRIAVTILPSPVNQYDFAYIDSLDMPESLNADAYTYEHFELDQYLDTSGSCAYNFVKLSDTESKGAANYFSEYNPDKEGAQAFVPDADKVPFQITRYTPDNTGRVQETSGGIGMGFEPLAGRSVRYIYDQPANGDLEDYFQSQNRGDAQYYKRKHVVDQNGQRRTVYQNMHGNTVLSILAGTPPLNLISVDGSTTQTPRVNDLTDFNQWIGDEYVSNYSRIIDPGRTYQVNYSVDIPSYNTTCSNTPICFDCVYDIELIITAQNPCVASVYDTLFQETKRAGKFREQLNNCNSNPTYALNGGSSIVLTPVISKPTTLFITKRIVLNDSIAEAYADFYMEESGCVPNAATLFKSKLSDVLAEADSCMPDKCGTQCEDQIGSFSEFLHTVSQYQAPDLIPSLNQIPVPWISSNGLWMVHLPTATMAIRLTPSGPF
ncbi:hypothetical protein KFE98_16075 [bacterium SCSIO 12741]|nr:hypothetical protein KFE98_16075 [bacterium SCSIO 12741]